MGWFESSITSNPDDGELKMVPETSLIFKPLILISVWLTNCLACHMPPPSVKGTDLFSIHIIFHVTIVSAVYLESNDIALFMLLVYLYACFNYYCLLD
jgi:hypothetical protein